MERLIVGYLFLAGISTLLCAVLIAQEGNSVSMVLLWVALGISWIVFGVLQAKEINRRGGR